LIIGEFFEQKREIVPFDYIPDWLVKGVISSEDRDFYNHRVSVLPGFSGQWLKIF
jgi:membrane peptidoglycan carboxypeptidase